MCIKDKGRLWPGEMGSMCQGPQTEVAQNQKARHFFWNYADEHCLNNDNNKKTTTKWSKTHTNSTLSTFYRSTFCLFK